MGAKPQTARDDANRPHGPKDGANGAAVRTPSLTETTPQSGKTPAGAADNSAETETATVPALYTGMVVDDRFVIVRQLGAGGMGEVYEAQDLLGRERIALKTIRTEYASKPGAIERFKGEVQLGASISHPNLCAMRSLFVWRRPMGDLWFFTMKLLSGETLGQRLHRCGQLEPAEAIAFAKGIASALDVLHETEVVHRDLKPSNIFLEETRTGEKAVVTDFGLARSYSEGAPLTEAGRAPGTPSYMAPEVLAGEQATPAADIYSFGVVLHEMLFAHRPESASSTEVKLALPAAKLRRIRSIVAKCLDRDPNRRFARAGAAAQALDAAFRYEPLATMSRRRMLIGSSAAALVATGSFWTEREQVEEWSANLLHPIPRPRHVAVMPADAHLTVDDASLLNGLMDTVGTTLARAELAERDLVVLPPRFLLDQKVEGISQALGLLGANLILSAALRRSEKAVHITIQLAEAATGKLLRSAELSCAAGIIYTLSALAADKAARLLNVPRRDFLRSTGGETSNPEAFAAFERGRNALNNGTPEQAITDLQKAVDIDPDFALAWAILGQAYATDYRLKQDWATLELAGRSAEKALRLDPALPAAYTGRASVERERGQYELAVRDLKTAMRLDPEDMDAQLTLARTYAVCGKLDWADRAFERVLDQRPNKWIALNDWGLLYYGRANYTRAAQLFREATMAAPQAALPWQNLGAAYLMMEELDEAARALEESIRLFPIAGAYSDRGTALFWAKKYRGAANDFERAVRLSPGNYTFWRNLGDCYSMLSEKKPQAAAAWERAAALARETLTINPKNGDAVADLAVLQAKLGRRAAALELMDRVQALGALNADRLFAEVQVCELAGRRDMALKLLKECVRLGYSQADIRYAPELQELRSDPRFKDLGIPAKSAG